MAGGVRRWLAALETRYGRKAAVAVGLAAIALVAVPVPGLVFLAVGLADLFVRARDRRFAAKGVFRRHT